MLLYQFNLSLSPANTLKFVMKTNVTVNEGKHMQVCGHRSLQSRAVDRILKDQHLQLASAFS